jgi:hypothetical protein
MKPKFDSTRIAEAMIADALPEVPALRLVIPNDPNRRRAAALQNIREIQSLADRHERKVIPARREELTAGSAFKNVNRILTKRPPMELVDASELKKS